MKKIRAFSLVLLLILGLGNSVGATEALPPGAAFDVGFSPKGGSLELVLKVIDSARQEILVASYSFTSKPIATALVKAAHRGVRVMLVADEQDNSKKFTAAQYLADHHIPVRLNGNYAILHSKYILIDSRHLETGSFNYSAAAVQRNAENVLVLWNVPSLVATYKSDWERLWTEGTDLKPHL